jgi:hypothetical protein
MITGKITSISPASIVPGRSLRISVSFQATNTAYKWTHWSTRVSAVTQDGRKGENAQTHPPISNDGSRDNEPIYLGIMPNKTITGSVTLEGRMNVFESWKTLDVKNFIVAPPQEFAPPELVYEPPTASETYRKKWWEVWKSESPTTKATLLPEPEEGVDIKTILIATGILTVAIFLLTRRR